MLDGVSYMVIEMNAHFESIQRFFFWTTFCHSPTYKLKWRQIDMRKVTC